MAASTSRTPSESRVLARLAELGHPVVARHRSNPHGRRRQGPDHLPRPPTRESFGAAAILAPTDAAVPL